MPDTAGGEGGHRVTKPDGVIHGCIFNLTVTSRVRVTLTVEGLVVNVRSRNVASL
jgi:hypothetical protein